MVYESNYRPTHNAYGDELMHYGVKGMKWGVRRGASVKGGLYAKPKPVKAGVVKGGPTSPQRQAYLTAKANKRAAHKEYKKAFNKAYNRSIAAWSPVKKHRQANDARWDNAIKKADASNAAKKTYKDAKKAYKQTDEYKAKRAKAVKVGAAVAGTALAAYGAYKVSKVLKDKAATKSYNAGKTSVRRLMAAAERSAQAGDWGGYAMSMQTARESAKRNAAQTEVFRNSTVEAAKYLYRSRRR